MKKTTTLLYVIGILTFPGVTLAQENHSNKNWYCYDRSLGISTFVDENRCPANEDVCSEELITHCESLESGKWQELNRRTIFLGCVSDYHKCRSSVN